jgi:hypothetical protein
MTKLTRVTDPLATIEAAYDSNPDFESWARGVLESSVPVFDAGLGVLGMTIRISERARSSSSEPAHYPRTTLRPSAR